MKGWEAGKLVVGQQPLDIMRVQEGVDAITTRRPHAVRSNAQAVVEVSLSERVRLHGSSTHGEGEG